MATGASEIVLGDTIVASRATVSRCLREVSDYFYANMDQYMEFPYSLTELEEAADAFNAKFPPGIKVIGLMDGTHVLIVCPDEFEENYLNRHGNYSLNVMVS